MTWAADAGVTFGVPNPNGDDELWSHVLGGVPYAPSPGAVSLRTQHPSGYVGFGETTGRYRVGGASRSIEVTGGGFVNTYRNIGVGPSYGGAQTVRALTALGRGTKLEVNEAVHYSPFFSLGVFGPLATPERSGMR